MGMRRILPSITSVGGTQCSWRDKIAEVRELALNEFSLFVTGLTPLERKECFAMLKVLRRECDFKIPFVHAVSEMCEDEFWYLTHEFGTEKFNLHPVREFPLSHALSSRIRERIYIENSTVDAPLGAGDIEGFAGICLDVSHLEDLKRTSEQGYAELVKLLETYPIGANHISAVGPNPNFFVDGVAYHSNHVLGSAKELSYLSSFPRQFFSEICAIELENPLSQQLSLIPVVRAEIEKALDMSANNRKAA